ncbi:MAG: aldolase/citrate lyase family protein [Pseudomonadota bacterium]
MAAPRNSLKAALAAQAVTKGLWLNLASDAATEIAGHSGADWCLIDGEHTAFDPTRITAQARVLAGTPAAPVVRLPAAEPWMLGQVLDAGVQSIMVPRVDTAEAAAAMVAACRYPPRGTRGVGPAVSRAGGYGRLSMYTDTAEAELCLIVQAETARALDNLEAMAAVDGIDCVFIGPSDLAANTGLSGAALDHILGDAITRITATGKVAGIFASAETAPHYAALGARMIAVGSEAMILATALKGALA